MNDFIKEQQESCQENPETFPLPEIIENNTDSTNTHIDYLKSKDFYVENKIISENIINFDESKALTEIRENNQIEIKNESLKDKLCNKIMNAYLKNVQDRIVLLKYQRWIFTFTIALIFILRVLLLPGYFAIAYLLAFRVIRLSILFITPQGVPSIIDELDDEENGGSNVENSYQNDIET